MIHSAICCIDKDIDTQTSLWHTYTCKKQVLSLDEKLGDLSAVRDGECLQKIINPKGDMTFDQLLE